MVAVVRCANSAAGAIKSVTRRNEILCLQYMFTPCQILKSVAGIAIPVILLGGTRIVNRRQGLRGCLTAAMPIPPAAQSSSGSNQAIEHARRAALDVLKPSKRDLQ